MRQDNRDHIGKNIKEMYSHDDDFDVIKEIIRTDPIKE
jgi:hypothetical protein